MPRRAWSDEKQGTMIIKICQKCLRFFTWETFKDLEQLGIQDIGDGEQLQYANCTCRSTLCVGVDTQGRPTWDSMVDTSNSIWQYNFED